jgi:hypothetical protein
MQMLGVAVPEAKIPKNIQGNLTFADCDPEELARQLTLIDFKLYDSILPIELMNQAWGRAK